MRSLFLVITLSLIFVSEAFAATITILAPTAGEDVVAGSTYNIRWETTDLDDVSIKFSDDGGSSWSDITSTVDTGSPNWGSFPWSVPNKTTTEGIILITGYFGEVPTQSEAFSIVDSGAGGSSDDESGGCVAVDPSSLTLIALGLLFVVRRQRTRS